MKSLETKIDIIAEDVNEIKISNEGQRVTMEYQAATLQKLTEAVEVHIARTDALETLVGQNRAAAELALNEALKPLRERDNFLRGVAWTMGSLIALGLTVIGLVISFVK